MVRQTRQAPGRRLEPMRVVYKQFNVRDIAPMAAGGLPHLGYGFAIADLHGSPLLSVM